MTGIGAAILETLLAPRCAGCDAPGAWLCLACREARDPVRSGRVHAAGVFEGPLRRALHRFKYQGERGLAAELGALVAARVAADLASGVALDVVVPAVLHRDRARLRGYDQAARAANVRGAFLAEADALRGLRVALVNDVATTGATLAAASGALRAAGARDVRAYVVALDA